MILPIIGLLLYWKFCLILISELNLIYLYFLGEEKRKGVNHINFGFMTPVTTGLPRFSNLVAPVSGRLIFNSSPLQHNSETFASHDGSTIVHLGSKIIYWKDSGSL